MTDQIQLYEELSLNSHPSLQTQLYDGWILRYANGYTNRANSVNPLYPSIINPELKIAECESRYFSQGLSVVYKLTTGTDPYIDYLLEQQGYQYVTPTDVQDMALSGKKFTFGDCIITNHADEAWFDAYFSFNHYTDQSRMQTCRQIIAAVKSPMLCARIIKNGATVACASAVIERGYMSLLNVVVDETQRGKGFGTELCESILSASMQNGAHTAYLQVVQDNQTAKNLYAKLGYTTQYYYWYRVKQQPTGR